MQLASFMSELESSGLLERDSAQQPAQDTVSHSTNTAQADSGISTSPEPQNVSEAQPSLATSADSQNLGGPKLHTTCAALDPLVGLESS